MSRLRACWVTHAPVGVGCHPEDVDLAGCKLDHEQHVQALEQDRVDVEEVDGQDPFGLRGEELPPRQTRAVWRRVGARPVEEQPDSACRNRVPKPRELTMDAPVPHVGFSVAIRRVRRRSSDETEGRPGGRCGLVQWCLTSWRCQRSRVCGVTSRWRRRCLGSRRVNADSVARSGQVGRGRATCRRRTATSCRSTRISVFLDACPRPAMRASR
jgi:hypothetical protein